MTYSDIDITYGGLTSSSKLLWLGVMNSSISRWQEESRETVFQKYGRGVDKVIYTLPDGQQHEFYIKNEKHAAGVLALTKDKQVVLVRQYRPGPDEILVDIPCGYIDANEKPQDAARRELLEETGYDGKLSFVVEAISEAYSNHSRFCFVATDCELVQEPSREEAEFMEVVLMPLKEYRAWLKKGKSVFHPAGYAGLDYLGLL